MSYKVQPIFKIPQHRAAIQMSKWPFARNYENFDYKINRVSTQKRIVFQLFFLFVWKKIRLITLTSYTKMLDEQEISLIERSASSSFWKHMTT